MNKIFFLIIFLWCNKNLVAQNITLDQLIALRSKSIGEVEEFLTSKKWQFLSATKPDDSSYGTVRFAFEKNNYNDKASSFINYYYHTSKDIFPNRINLQIVKQTIYNSYLSRLKALGYKLVESKIKDGRIVKIYKGKTLTIEAALFTNGDEYSTSSGYQIFICENADYDAQFG